MSSRPTGFPVDGTHASPNPLKFPWLRTVLASVLAIALFVGIAGARLYDGLYNQVKDAVIDTSVLANANDSEPIEQAIPADGFAGRPVNLLIVGIDSRFGDNGNIGAGNTEDFESILNDTNMLLNISADRQSATVVSIPRDLKTEIAQCQTPDGNIAGGYYAQFNWSFGEPAIGSDQDLAAGISCVQATTELLTGLNIDGFVVIDFIGFQGLINTLGGLNICLDEAVEDEEAGLRRWEVGCHTMPPDQALAYSRARKNIGNGSDIGRIGRQHQVVSAMVQQVLDANILTDFLKLHGFVQEGLKTVSVSGSLGDLRTDMGLLNSVRNVAPENFRFVTVPWEADIEDPNRVVQAEPYASELWTSLQNNAPLPPGIGYRTVKDEYFIVGPDGQPIPAVIDDSGVITRADEVIAGEDEAAYSNDGETW